MRIERHPIGVWVREDGCIYLPQSGSHPAHWTFGSKHNYGYRRVRIEGRDYLVHRLVADAYFGDIPDGMEVDHIDRNCSNNAVENLRIVTHSENQRNTSKNDRVEDRGGTHSYEDVGKYYREKDIRYHQFKRKTHRRVRFSDGSYRWFPHEEALELLKIPLKQRIFAK